MLSVFIAFVAVVFGCLGWMAGADPEGRGVRWMLGLWSVAVVLCCVALETALRAA
jgi:hypothetical protein